MSKYLPKVECRTEFDGDSVTAIMTPLSRESFVRVASIDSDEMSEEAAAAAYVTACDVLKEHLESVVGVRDANGDAVAVETILNDVYFMPLVLQMFAELVERAALGKVKSADLGAK